MTDIIEIKSINKNVAEGKPILLEQTSDTALCFYPHLHPGGVGGNLVRFKKNRNQEWERIPAEDFRKLDIFQGSRIKLGTNQLKILIEEVNKLQEIVSKGIKNGKTTYFVAEGSKNNFTDLKNILDRINQQENCSEELSEFFNSESAEILNKIAEANSHQRRKKVID